MKVTRLAPIEYRVARYEYVVFLRGQGLLFKQIAYRLGVHPCRARQLFLRGGRSRTPHTPDRF